MTVLVTGGAGYIGSHTVLALLDAGEPVVVVDNLSTGSPDALPRHVPLLVQDIGDEAMMAGIIRSYGVDVIIHLAGSVVVQDSVRDPLAYYRNNTVAAHGLLSAAVRCKVKHFVFSSTAAVYGNPAQLPVPETAATDPQSPYGASKLIVERMLQDVAAAHSMRYVILRYFNVAGADPDGRAGLSAANATHLIKIAVELATGQRSQMDIFGTDYPTPDGTCIRDFVHVSDLAQVHRIAVSHLARGGRSAILNCGYGRGYSVLEVLACVRKLSRKDFTIRHAERRPGDIVAMVADVRRIRSELGWVPQHDDLNAMIADALAWENKLVALRNLRKDSAASA
ncbi:UDP-glucose 4-epimerase GalE [Bradyrhizobium sp. 21]|uniref:UDP-glucose 4-epimerase GalE n=1 Tax=Bradyrhizobium sp. 21 TaxID=2782666 RepID=UPI001FFA83F3|nr:UDP-glucose 4-epimerase GalE [Bradyrhizobium sp. 21]MCK1384094.1 UDP-glucose 4-epimerase GalE [Bradyrhizobium sp. 21]